MEGMSRDVVIQRHRSTARPVLLSMYNRSLGLPSSPAHDQALRKTLIR